MKVLQKDILYDHPGLTFATSDQVDFTHVTATADYAFRIKNQLANVNEHSFNNFQLRIGIFQKT